VHLCLDRLEKPIASVHAESAAAIGKANEEIDVLRKAVD
jgi:hypothetical protein